MKVSVYGSGYVGLVQAACLSDVGHQVICLDIDPNKINKLSSGEVPIYEPGLEDIVKRNMIEGRLKFSADLSLGVTEADVLFVAVGTPSLEDGSTDLSHIQNCVEAIAHNMSQYKLVVIKSTVPVGTCDMLVQNMSRILKARKIEIDFDVASNPEFLKEGSAIEDFTHSDRIVIGSNSENVFATLRSCYSPFNRKKDKIIEMSLKSAELTKYASNAFLATKISFMNEISQTAETLGVDIEEVRNGIGSDKRIGFNFIYPGCGYGGSCFPKDLKSLIASNKELGLDSKILRAVEEVNDHQKKSLFKKLNYALNGEVEGRSIALWGLSFKPGTDDMRESPSRIFIEEVINAGGNLKTFDPEAMEECKKIYGSENISYQKDPLSCLEGSIALVICTEWQLFWKIEPKQIKEYLYGNTVIDGRNIFSPEEMKEEGLQYYGVGRGLIHKS